MGSNMSELLQEYVDSGNHTLRVDRKSGVIRGVKLLGLRSRNGRRYQENALAEAVGLYEGAKVNINHPKGHPLSPRDYQDRLGVIRGVEFRAQDGLFGDLHFNPKHTLSEQLMWDAEHASQNVGLSHNVLARTARDGEDTVVEAITKVQSIDLVADPATTRGLFEQESGSDANRNGGASPSAVAWDELTVEQLALHRPDLLRELEQAHAVQLESLRHELDRAAASTATLERRGRILELLQEHHLPLPDSRYEASRRITSEQFVESLLNAADDNTLERLVEERAALVKSAKRWNSESGRLPSRPISREQLTIGNGVGGGIRDAKEFAATICER